MVEDYIYKLLLTIVLTTIKKIGFYFQITTSSLPQGMFQKAEALYNAGDFEMALVYYHRGNRLRPELLEFRLGIQKAREAIINCVGSKL